ncbi:MAG: FtsH protease activity modulator HflK [Pseudomonadota bacterium]
MAWNQPGGNQQDPWRGGGRQQGGNDLEDLLKKLQAKFSGSRGGPQQPTSPKLILLGIAVVAALWLLSGFYRVNEAEQAVILRVGALHKITGPGLQWHLRGVDKVLKINTQLVDSYRHKAQMLTGDNKVVQVAIETQFRVDDPVEYFLKNADPRQALAEAAESALRQVIGGQDMVAIITEARTEVAREVTQILQQYLNQYQAGIEIVTVNLEDANPPGPVKEAFDDVTRAKEDQATFETQAEAYRKEIVAQATGRKQRLLEEASGDKEKVIAEAEGDAARFEKLLIEYEKAPQITRQRLHLETMERVLSGSNKVLLSGDGNQPLLYLPIDKINSRISNMNDSSSIGSSTGGLGTQSSEALKVPTTLPSVRNPIREGR